ncbi:MAG: hypothetical protein HYU28_05055 [Actinobacteria bacterium]|nr:hypothetical protein [Actinomycetota bacterium]
MAHLRTFRCNECRRLLKVPGSVAVAEKARTGTAPANGESRPEDAEPTRVDEVSAASDATAAKVPPSQRGSAVRDQAAKLGADPGPNPAAGTPPLSRVVRVLVWMAAVPSGLVPVAILGRLFGVLTMDRAVDVFLGIGWDRFVPPLVLLPIWAAASATVAHLALEGLARLRHETSSDRQPAGA